MIDNLIMWLKDLKELEKVNKKLIDGENQIALEKIITNLIEKIKLEVEEL